LANMSHEIRTPMNAILGFTELLRRSIENRKLKSYVKTIQSAGNDLLQLLNDILDLSKIEAGKMEVRKSAVNPHMLFDELGQFFKLSANNKGLELLIDVDAVIPEVLLLDLTRLRQVLINLMGNAIKFTEQGYVRLHARVVNEHDIRSQIDLQIDIEDTGAGIGKNDLESIFKAFEQAEALNSSKYEGTGLGLSISSKLIKLMGGEISVNSEQGKGSTFSLHLNGVDVGSIAELSSDIENLDKEMQFEFEPGFVLVVDDIFDNRLLISENFKATGLNVIEARNGKEAVDIVRKNKVDLILMDLRMPVMNGYEAALIIKKSFNIPILALTASVMKDEFDRIKSNVCNFASSTKFN